MKWIFAWLRSWTKPAGAWRPEDYPIEVRPNVGDGATGYSARVLRWDGMVGLGETGEAARQDLFENLATMEDRPRPGAKVSIEYAESGQIARYGDWAFEVVAEIAEVQPFFMSDSSSLSDFGDPELLLERVRERYGVDVSDLGHGNIVAILDRLTAVGKGPSNP